MLDVVIVNSVPFTGCIQGGLHEGKTITVTGRVLPGSQRFHVNLQCGSKEVPDVALHFNPQYDDSRQHAACNTMLCSKWGPRGSYIFVLSEVIVNGAHFMEYLHQMSITQVDTIFVSGDVEIESIAFSNSAPVQLRKGFANTADIT
ncbi:galectin-9-like [Oncorhynchus kisutch]|uniref:galectin-9-like n=1 Tax=Oncorhynchus kisutch TaxID=8019 RepID=UPI0012DD3826|nr:galectin-9-like [Oncorhynchus kisutch]